MSSGKRWGRRTRASFNRKMIPQLYWHTGHRRTNCIVIAANPYGRVKNNAIATQMAANKASEAESDCLSTAILPSAVTCTELPFVGEG